MVSGIKVLFIAILILLLVSLTSQLNAKTLTLNSVDEGGAGIYSGELLHSQCASTAVVLFHGRGQSPDGPVVDELRKSLHRAGYTTLSIQNPLPLSGNTAFSEYVADITGDNYVFPEAYARMRAAINYLQSTGVQTVVIGGFSLGSRLATAHVARGQINELPISGLLGVGMYATSIDPLNISTTLDEVSVPVLDVYGDNDTNAVATAAARLSAYESGSGINYTQLILDCDDGINCHQLAGLKGDDSQALEVSVNAWMQAVSPAGVIAQCAEETEVEDNGGGGNISFFLLLSMMLTMVHLRGADTPG